MWHTSLTKENENDLERVQKTSMKIIFGESYKGYKNAMNRIGLTSLSERREALCLNFARKCTKNEKMNVMFPIKSKKSPNDK